MTKGQTQRMVAYLRVSSGKQARSGLGEAAQRTRITAAAEAEGWEIVAWLVDRGETGKNANREAFLSALQMIADHDADGLVAAKLDRVARSVIDFASLLAWFTAGEKVLAILDPAIDTSTASGRLVANVFSAVAEWEGDTISDRTSQALQAKRASGLPICRPSVADDTDLVARIQSLREEGSTLQGICDVLNAEGIPTLRGAAQWRISAVQSALGYQRPKRHKVPNLPEIRRTRQRSRTRQAS
jgi:DNA invertase Pin-like site-specific DNA recombinase